MAKPRRLTRLPTLAMLAMLAVRRAFPSPRPVAASASPRCHAVLFFFEPRRPRHPPRSARLTSTPYASPSHVPTPFPFLPKHKSRLQTAASAVRLDSESSAGTLLETLRPGATVDPNAETQRPDATVDANPGSAVRPDSGSSVGTPVETLRPGARVDSDPGSAVRPDSGSSVGTPVETLRPDARVDSNPGSAVRLDSDSSVGMLLKALRFDAPTDPNLDPECPDAGAETHGGCDDPIANGTPFDLWELARSWTPGFCGSGGKRTCAKKECALDAMTATLTLHGLWPSFLKPADLGGARGATSEGKNAAPRRAAVEPANANELGAAASCFWPQNCAEPSWLVGAEGSSSWRYDPALLPQGPENEKLAPAWYSGGLGAHEWPKHGTCASWADTSGSVPGFDQASYYAATFDLARREGTPAGLVAAAGSKLALAELQAMFGGPKKVALGCTSKCELVQVVTCYTQGKGTKDDPVGPNAQIDCPCTGVRDSHYDNSCAEKHACAEVTILSPEQTGCGGHPSPSPDACGDVLKCCPGVLGPACTGDAECLGESGCARCAHSGHCTNEPRGA